MKINEDWLSWTGPHYKNTLQNLAQGFRESGTRWGKLRNLAEVPLFVDSRMSRIIQLADLVAWAT